MHEEKVKEFDEYFVKNYEEHYRSCKTIAKSYVNDDILDILHDAYIKVRNRIEKSGFNGTNYGGYLYLSIKNEFLIKKRNEKKYKEVGYDINPNMYFEVEHLLLEFEEIAQSTAEYDRDLMYVSEKLFKFVEIHFDEKTNYVFRSYYLLPKQTYRKISARTNFTLKEISYIMKNTKKKIRKDFVKWVENE